MQITLSTAAAPSHIRKMTYTDPRSYLYQPGLLDPDATQRITRDALKACDDGELYLQYSATESFGFDDGRLKMADYSTGSGFGLRGVSGEMTGFSHANDMSEAAIRRAGETLKLLDPAKEQPAPPPRQNNRHLYTDGNPLELVPFAQKVALCQQIDAAARARDQHVALVWRDAVLLQRHHAQHGGVACGANRHGLARGEAGWQLDQPVFCECVSQPIGSFCQRSAAGAVSALCG